MALEWKRSPPPPPPTTQIKERKACASKRLPNTHTHPTHKNRRKKERETSTRLVLGEALQRREDVLRVDINRHGRVEGVGRQLVLVHERRAVDGGNGWGGGESISAADRRPHDERNPRGHLSSIQDSSIQSSHPSPPTHPHHPRHTANPPPRTHRATGSEMAMRKS